VTSRAAWRFGAALAVALALPSCFDFRPRPGPFCGDGICSVGEPGSCPADCSAPSVCGNLLCEVGESGANCPSDCGWCDDGYCNAGTYETCSGCPSDCTCGIQSCQEIRACAATCADDDSFCRRDCNAAGCAAAQAQTSQIFVCGALDCYGECDLDGFVSPACMACLMANCADALAACADAC
jgi:hypothetical protein